jgi:TonB family protein
MRMRLRLVLSSLVLICCGTLLLSGQQSSSDNPRPVVRKVIPAYPDAARRINLAGTVKLLATVAPNGTVKSIQPMGGSPILVQAAQEAVYRWQFAPGSAETKEPVELHFNPQQ